MTSHLVRPGVVYLGFSRDDTFISKVLRWFTAGNFSHSFVVVQAEAGLGRVVLESNWKGVWARPFSDYDGIEIELVPLGHPQAAGLPHWLLTRSGARYDYLGIFGFGLMIALKAVKIKVSNPFASPSAYFCSEAIVEGLQALGYPGAQRLEAGVTSPHALWAWATAP